jgi:hypothetical protein
MVATAPLLENQVPPVPGVSTVVDPSHIVVDPVILATGFALTVKILVGNEIQLVEVCVNVNVAVPAEWPVTIPALVTVAMPVLLLVQVPPVVGERVLTVPSQMEEPPVILTTGNALMVMDPVGFELHPLEAWV